MFNAAAGKSRHVHVRGHHIVHVYTHAWVQTTFFGKTIIQRSLRARWVINSPGWLGSTGSHGQRCRIHRHFWSAARRRRWLPPVVVDLVAVPAIVVIAAAVLVVSRHRFVAVFVLLVGRQIVFPAIHSKRRV